MNKNKFEVAFENNHIYQDGICVGHFDGSPELYVLLYNPEIRAKAAADIARHGSPMWYHEAKVAARFKYSSPKQNAKHYLKWALSQFSIDEVLAKIEAQEHKCGTSWAQELGYKNLNQLKYEKAQQIA